MKSDSVTLRVEHSHDFELTSQHVTWTLYITTIDLTEVGNSPTYAFLDGMMFDSSNI
jgi:hypothetical protein